MIHEPIKYDDSSRNATLDRMIGYGANISETEKQEVIDYLICFHP